MNRYKRELQLIGHSNLPTIKTIRTKTGSHVTTIDNYDIKSLTSAIVSLMPKSKHKTFTINKCALWSQDGIIKKDYEETRTFAYNSVTDIKRYLDHLRKVNKPNTIHMVYVYSISLKILHKTR